MKQIQIIITLVASLVSISLSAQHNHTTEEKHEHASTAHATDTHSHGKHKLAIYGGFTHVQASFVEHETGEEEATGKWVPTLGIDYFYTLNKKFDIGMISDIELDSYYVNEEDAHSGVNSEEKVYERANVVVLTPVLKYKPCHAVGIVLGAGVELESLNEDIRAVGVVKIGVEYEVPMQNGWELSPSFFYDLKTEYSTAAVGLSLGKRF